MIDTAKWAVGRRGSVERLTHRAAGSGAVVDHSTCAYCQTDTVQSVITLTASRTTMQHIKHLKWLHTSRKHALLVLHFSTHINRILRLMDVLADTNYTILYCHCRKIRKTMVFSVNIRLPKIPNAQWAYRSIIQLRFITSSTFYKISFFNQIPSRYLVYKQAIYH